MLFERENIQCGCARRDFGGERSACPHPSVLILIIDSCGSARRKKHTYYSSTKKALLCTLSTSVVSKRLLRDGDILERTFQLGSCFKTNAKLEMRGGEQGAIVITALEDKQKLPVGIFA